MTGLRQAVTHAVRYRRVRYVGRHRSEPGSRWPYRLVLLASLVTIVIGLAIALS